MKPFNWLSSRALHISKAGKHQLEFPRQFPAIVQRYFYSVDHRITPNFHDYLEVTCMLEGAGTFCADTKRYRIRENDILVVGNSQFHTIEVDFPKPMKGICLFFMPELVYSAGGNSTDFEYVRPFFDHSVTFTNVLRGHGIDDGAIRAGIQTIERVLRRKTLLYQLEAKNALVDILLRLGRYYQKFTGQPAQQHKKRLRDIERLKPVFALIEKSFHERISLDRASKAACLSQCHFCKLFKKVTGSRFTEYLMRMRMDKAKELLLKGGLSVGQVAYSVGFDNLSYFDRSFRKLTRFSPQEFVYSTARKRHS